MLDEIPRRVQVFFLYALAISIVWAQFSQLTIFIDKLGQKLDWLQYIPVYKLWSATGIAFSWNSKA